MEHRGSWYWHIKSLNGILEIAIIEPCEAYQYVIVIHPSTVGVTLNRDGRHFDNFLGVLAISLGQVGVQFGK